MGVVYRARDQHDLPIAIKTLRIQHRMSPQLVRRFRREARTAALLRGPAAVRVHDAGELDDGTLYYAMDLVEGESLRQRLRRSGPLPVDEVLLVLRQLAVGLIEAHDLGLVHRDLKPENLLLSPGPDGRMVLKVLDFGVVKILDERVGTVGGTETGQIFGTPEFMSPEQVRGATDLDARSDIFSAGVCVFLLLVGRLPYPATTPQGSMLIRLDRDAPHLSQACPRPFPVGLDYIVARMLARTQDERYPSMTAVLADVELLVASGAGMGAWAPLPPRTYSSQSPSLGGERLPEPPKLSMDDAINWEVETAIDGTAATVVSGSERVPRPTMLAGGEPSSSRTSDWVRLVMSAIVFFGALAVVAWALSPR